MNGVEDGSNLMQHISYIFILFLFDLVYYSFYLIFYSVIIIVIFNIIIHFNKIVNF